ncbi:hypothetical protein GTP56_05995 [Duganella sp. FT134W]|uniref:Integrase catalytic domain-containing protein n=1 Tax=Duganella margarita TaxID=2692170 RepID=A0A7X4GZ88_9BURK|nr:hypothetical protein [Duganella margarita]MYM71749.1 hypothetical protein [Duganella margarita]
MPPIITWPTAIADGMTKEHQELFNSRVSAIKSYFSGDSVKEIERVTGVNAKLLPTLAQKCLQIADDGRILGFRALLPYVRRKTHERSSPFKAKFPEAKGGFSGALNSLLMRFPDAEPMLVKMILQEKKNGVIHEYKIRPSDLHRVFIKFIKEKGVTEQEWPLNCKFRGIRSIQKYMKDLLDRQFAKGVSSRGDSAARAHINVGTGESGLITFSEAYECVEIDAYNIEAHMSVEIETPEGTYAYVLLERLWLIAAVEWLSEALLSYSIVYRSEVTADDVVKVIRDAATGKWEPMNLTLPLEYPLGAGLPSGVIEAAQGAQWSVTMLDGALAHLATSVHDKCRKAFGFGINWGAVGRFERRPHVEGFFNRVAKQLFKRLPSTTGSSPQNGRAEDAEKKAVEYRIVASDVEQVLDVVAAEMNHLPGGAFNITPLETLRLFFEDRRKMFLPRRLPECALENARTLLTKESHTVRGGRETGRRPYVQVDRARYTNDVLCNAGHLVGKKIVLVIDEVDMRQLKAYLPDGGELGTLKALGKWGMTKHSRRTRKAINRLCHRRILTLSEFDDPVQAYLRHLSTTEKNKSVSAQNATELTRVSKEAGIKPRIHAPVSQRSLPASHDPSNSGAPKPPKPGPSSISQAQERSVLRAVGLGDTDKFFNKVKNRR